MGPLKPAIEHRCDQNTNEAAIRRIRSKLPAADSLQQPVKTKTAAEWSAFSIRWPNNGVATEKP
jgi:hypothetical protein